MDRVASIAKFQWRAYWRQLSRARDLTMGHEGITLIVILIVLFKYVSLLRVAALEVSNGKTGRLESILAIIFLTLVLYPLALSRFSTQRWSHFPLSTSDLFRLRLISIFIKPHTWVLVVASLAVAFPLLQSPRPLIAVIAAVLFVSMSFAAGLALADLVSVRWGRWLIAIVFLLSGAAFINVTAGVDQFRNLLSVGPGHLVVRAAFSNDPLIAIGIQLLLAATALAMARWLFSLTAKHSSQTPRRLKSDSLLFKLPVSFSGLAAKDFRYFWRLLDPYFGVLASVICCIYLINSETPSTGVVLVLMLSIFVPNSSLAFNLFGFDARPAMERYALFPLSGAKILQSKNLAYGLFVAVQVLPVVVLATWRIGFTAGVLTVLQSISLTASYLAWGNLISIAFPARMRFYRFAPVSGALPEIVAGLFLCSVPGVLIVYWVSMRTGEAIWGPLLITVGFMTIYALTIFAAGRFFERRRFRIADING